MYKTFFCLFICSLLISCAQNPSRTAEKYVWPKPPAEARVVYETTLRNNDSLNKKSKENMLKSLATGVTDNEISALVKPYDIAARNGLIVVTDSLLNVAHVFDVPRRKMFAIGWRKEGKLNGPLGVAMDHQQNIYIVDSGRGAVVKYDRLGLYLQTIGQQSDFSRVTDVAVSLDGKKIFVLDRGGVDSSSHRVLVYNESGKKIKTIGQRGHNPGNFNHPTQIAVATNGNLYVLDAGNFRVQIFDEAGNYLDHWGKAGNRTGNFARPRGLAVDHLNRVFVTDGAYQNFQIFNTSGQLLLDVGSGGGVDQPGKYILPAGIAVDETQRIYVVDQIRKKIEVFKILSPTTSE